MYTIRTLLLAIAFPACLPSEPGPVTYSDLEGAWCSDANPTEVCLTVIQPYSHNVAPQFRHRTNTRYVLSVGTCFEHGTLTGGLEFDPDTDSRMCLPGFTYGLWSAGAEFTSTGLLLSNVNQADVSIHPDLELRYQP